MLESSWRGKEINSWDIFHWKCADSGINFDVAESDLEAGTGRGQRPQAECMLRPGPAAEHASEPWSTAQTPGHTFATRKRIYSFESVSHFQLSHFPVSMFSPKKQMLFKKHYLSINQNSRCRFGILALLSCHRQGRHSKYFALEYW